MKKVGVLITKTEDLLLMLCLTVSFLALLTQVISRYIFNMPMTWTEELARFLQIWITYVGVSFAIRYDTHIRITVIYDRVTPKLRAITQIFINLMIIFCLIVCMPGILEYYQNLTEIDSPLLNLPMNFVSLSLVIGFVLATLHLFVQIAMLAAGLFSKTQEELK